MNDERASTYRSPKGVLSEKPIGLRLMPHEREIVKRLADAQGRSMSSQARILILKGLESERDVELTP